MITFFKRVIIEGSDVQSIRETYTHVVGQVVYYRASNTGSAILACIYDDNSEKSQGGTQSGKLSWK